MLKSLLLITALLAIPATSQARQNSINHIFFGTAHSITPAVRADTFFTAQNAGGTIFSTCDDCAFNTAVTGGSTSGSSETVTFAGSFPFPLGVKVTVSGATPTTMDGTITTFTSSCTGGVCTLTGGSTNAAGTWTSGGTVNLPPGQASIGTFTDATSSGQFQMMNVRTQFSRALKSNTFKGFGLLAITLGGTDTLIQSMNRQVYNTAAGGACPLPSCASSEYATQLVKSTDGGVTWTPTPASPGTPFGTTVTVTNGTMTNGTPVTAVFSYISFTNYTYGVGQNVQIISGTTAFFGNWTVTTPATCSDGSCTGLQMYCVASCFFTATPETTGSMIPPYVPSGGAPMWPSNDFTTLGFFMYGQDYTCAYNGFSGCITLPDGASSYVYLLSDGGRGGGLWTNGSEAYLARVLQSDIASLDPSKYQYFCGGDGSLGANWSSSATAGRLPNGQTAAFGADPVVHGTTCDAVPIVSDPALGALGGNGKISVTSPQYIPGPGGTQGVYLALMTYYPANNQNPGEPFSQYTVWTAWQAQHPWGPWCKFQVQEYNPEGYYTPTVLTPSISSDGTMMNITFSGNFAGSGPSYTTDVQPITISYNSTSSGNFCGW